MWAAYREIAHRYGRISLRQERRLIARAQEGSRESTEEIVLRHLSFAMFRVRAKLYPEVIRRFGEDILPEAIILLYEKVRTYDLRYRDKLGHRKRVRFTSYIWKRVDGFIVDYIKNERKHARESSSSAPSVSSAGE